MSPALRNLLIAVACLAAAGVGALAWTLTQGEADGSAAAGPGSSPAPPPAATATSTPTSRTPDAQPSEQRSGKRSSSPTPQPRIELRGDDLAVTRIGAPRDQAVAAVAAVLGAGDTSPDTVGCVGSDSEAAWPDLRLGFDAQGRLNGWSVGTGRLETPSGVRVGTRVATLREVYGSALTIHPPNPDSGHTYGVEGVDMVGFLSGDGPEGTVEGLANGACSGP